MKHYSEQQLKDASEMAIAIGKVSKDKDREFIMATVRGMVFMATRNEEAKPSKKQPA